MKIKEMIDGEQVKSCIPATTLHIAAKVMADHNCGALPVVDEEQKVVGIVTDRDICLTMAKKHPKSPARLTVGEIMHKTVRTVKENEEIASVYQTMREHQIGRVPVVDDKGRLKGIVSLHKMLNNSIQKKHYLGDASAIGENLIKTIAAVSGRYTNGKTEENKTDHHKMAL